MRGVRAGQGGEAFSPVAVWSLWPNPTQRGGLEHPEGLRGCAWVHMVVQGCTRGITPCVQDTSKLCLHTSSFF